MKKLVPKMLIVVILSLAFLLPVISFAAWGDYECTVTKVQQTFWGPKVFLERVSDSEPFECWFNENPNENLAIALTAISSGAHVMANFDDTSDNYVISNFSILPL